MNFFIALCFWLSERLRDVAMWPIHLVRDFPVRFGRLCQTLWQGSQTFLQLFPQTFQAIQQKRFRQSLRTWPGRFLFWLHQLLAQLFDLVGGPEIVQFFTHLITHTTPLTADEMSLIASVLGPNAIRLGEVRVAEGGFLDLVFRLNGNLAYNTWHTVHFPRFGRHTRANLPILVHELTHVYQYECVGSRYLGEAIYLLITTKRDCYVYGGREGLKTAVSSHKSFAHYNREQQAQLVQDFFTLKQQGLDTAPYEPFIHQMRSGHI